MRLFQVVWHSDSEKSEANDYALSLKTFIALFDHFYVYKKKLPTRHKNTIKDVGKINSKIGRFVPHFFFF